ncbi:hypothetical protein L6R29_25655 [Myxococcota bacterium]|nr:hypothetical protein [Myxococcota bacterium]
MRSRIRVFGWLCGAAVLCCVGACEPTKPPVPAVGWDGKIYELPIPERSATCAVAESAEKLKPCAEGSGAFGFWRIDEQGLPAYEYTLDQRSDPKAFYKHSRNKEPRTHLHQIGNDRLNGIAYNEGYVELMSQERGVTYHNRFDEKYRNYTGGFSLLEEDGVVWNTAQRWMPAEAKARRVFGAGYVTYITQYRGIRLTKTIHAASGDLPALVSDVVIENLTPNQREIRHYEYWDVNRHQAVFQPLRTKEAGDAGDIERDLLNKSFTQKVQWDAKAQRVWVEFVKKPDISVPAKEAVSTADLHPSPIFLAAVAPSAVVEANDLFTDQSAFWGQGGPTQPEAVKQRAQGSLLEQGEAFRQNAMFAMRHSLSIAPKATLSLRFVYGYLPSGHDASFLQRYADPETQQKPHIQRFQDKLAYFVAPDAPFLSREVPWHAYNLLSSVNTLDYFKAAVTPQGSAYLYLHGFDGAPRDHALFSMPLVYLRPDLARGNLRLIMGMTRAEDGGISYSYHGNGYLENAIIHKYPSDLDIFFLASMAEYLAATGDRAFLKEKIAFHPGNQNEFAGKRPSYVKDDTVLDHIRCAFYHLKGFVKRGPNGLIRIWDGDWSDGIVWENGEKYDANKSIQSGESIPNTQMALYALPLMAEVIEPDDAVLAGEMRAFAAELLEPIRKEFLGKYFARAWLRDRNDQPVHVGVGGVDLESQPWGIMAEQILDPAQKTALLDHIHERLDKDSPIGPPFTPGGAVWPAISQLVTWAYALHQPERAWQTLLRQTYHAHATQWPDLWFGIWSGADGFFSKSGNAWDSVATPMTDWPVMNLNQDAMFLLGLLRVAGIRPHRKGILIQPTGAPKTFSLKFPLVSLTVEAKSAKGEYTAANDGEVWLYFNAPFGQTLKQATLQTAQGTEILTGAGPLGKAVQVKTGEIVRYTIAW